MQTAIKKIKNSLLQAIEFSIENPNEISYYIDVVGDYLNDTLFDFGKFTNIMLSHTIEYDGPRLYLNKTLKREKNFKLAIMYFKPSIKKDHLV